MLGNIDITQAEFRDLSYILALQKQAFLSEAELYNIYTIEPLTQTIESIRNDFKEYVFLVAKHNNKIVGSVKTRDTGESCWIGRLIVNPDLQNQGIGKRLMAEVEKLFPSARQFVLFTGFKSTKNIAFYESLGYKKYEEFTDEKNPGVKLVKMIKENITF